MPFTLIYGDSFTSDGTAKKIPLPGSADYFVTTNITQMPLAPVTPVVVRGEWYGPKFGAGATAANDGLRWKKTTITNAINIDTFSTATASNGFTYVTTSPVVEAQAANAITAITAASPAVVTQTNTYNEGDFLRIYGTTGMLQIAGMVFQISSVSGAGYTLKGLGAVGFAAAATAGFTRRISKNAAVDPEYLYITNISKATRAVVTTSVDPTPYYVVGMKIYFSVPTSFGMSQINGLTGKIVAVDATNYTLTVDIDSSAFTTFAFPASTSSPTAQLFATLSPAGVSTQFNPVTLVQTGYDFLKQPFRTGQFVPYMSLAGGAQSPGGATSDIINWAAYKFEN
jgi:hypothetical protein